MWNGLLRIQNGMVNVSEIRGLLKRTPSSSEMLGHAERSQRMRTLVTDQVELLARDVRA